MLDIKNKIAFYLPNTESGGAEKMIIILANSLAKKGYNVTLFLGSKQGPFYEQINRLVNIVLIGDTSIFKTSLKLFFKIKKLKPSIFCVTKSHVNTIVALYTPFLRNTKVILREANTPSVEYEYANGYTRFIMNIAKATYRLANKYVAVSDGVANDMVRFYGVNKDKIQTIYNPVISNSFYELSKQDVKHPFFLEKEKNSDIYIFVAVGRLMPQKDYPTMIEAFSEACKKNVNLRLLILGRVESNNPDYDLVFSKINNNELKEKISFVGFVSNPYKYLLKSDCFIQTSLFEGLPGTLVQALGLRKNIIATNCKSGPEEVLNYGRYGSLVEIKNTYQISEEILKYSYGKINDKADDEFLSQFTNDVSTEKYLRLFSILTNVK